MGGAGLWVATEIGGPKRRLLGVVYFYFKSNSPSLINEFVEGSDSVPGEGKRKKKERGTRFIWSCARGERGEFQPRSGVKGGFLCALFGAEVLTEGP